MNRTRVEIRVSQYSNIRKLWNWNHLKNEYEPAKNCYVATRKRTFNGKTIKARKTFSDLASALSWQKEILTPETFSSQAKDDSSPPFKSVVKQFFKNKVQSLRASTQENYQALIDKGYLDYLMDYQMNQITPAVVDMWIDYLKSLPRKSIRESFYTELTLLTNIINFYISYDDNYVSPVKKRHRNSIVVKNIQKPVKELSEADFKMFRDYLEQHYGLRLAAMATIQYYQALRISEVAALEKEDFKINDKNPNQSIVFITRSVRYSKDKKSSEIQQGFKNSKVNGGFKALPLMKESYLYYKKLISSISTSQLFLDDKEKLFNYRAIENAYNRSFKGAGLKVSGTHVLRHGGASDCYDKSGGDLGVVQQLLCNTDLKSVQVYARRHKKALAQYNTKNWKSDDEINNL